MSRLMIPLDVLPDIFCLLPVEALVRFRSLSKTCCSLIDSPEFVKLHLNQSIKTRSVRTIFVKKPNVKGSIYAVDLDSSGMCPVKLKNVKSRRFEYHVIGSCNGLLAVNIGENISLWNPWTRKYQILPISSKFSLISYIGFGYDAISDDYKVIIFRTYQNQFRVFIYCLKTNSSKRIDFDLDHHYFHIGNTCGVFVGGSLHWIYEVRGNMRIMTFDLGEDKFNYLMLPDEGRHLPVTSLAELGGCLSIGCTFHCDRLEIWIMKEYGDEESWAKLLSLSCIEPERYFYRWGPLCYSRNGDKVILTDLYGEFLWYDVEQKRVVKRVDFFKSSRYAKISTVSTDICIRSLVPLSNNVENTRTGKKRKRRRRGSKLDGSQRVEQSK